jgi:peroxiredoxin
VRADIVPGGIFPDYELTDHTKTRRRLSELQGMDPMILVLSRGHYCPKDHQQHLELAAFYPQIAAGYTQIVTIATDNILAVNDFRASVGAQWIFLSDAGRASRRTSTSRNTRTPITTRWSRTLWCSSRRPQRDCELGPKTCLAGM